MDLGEISSGLRQAEDGLWHATSSTAISYPAEGHEICAQVEDRSFWFWHRNNCIIALAKKFSPHPGGAIFDVGGGNGYVAQGLEQAGFDAVVVEPGAAGAQAAKARGLKRVVHASLEDANFRSESLPAIGLFDVVEHIEDDAAFLALARPLLKPGGRLYLTVPAYSALWSAEDEYSGHYRRYSKDSISQVLESAGFSVLFASYIFRFLPLPIFVFRSLPFRLGLRGKGLHESAKVSRDHSPGGEVTSKIIDMMLRPELRRISAGNPMSFGGSCLVAATRG